MIKSLIYSSISALAILSSSAPLCAEFQNNINHEYMAQATPGSAPAKSSADENLKGKEAERRFLESPIGLQAEGTPTLVIQTIALASMAMLPFLLMLLTPFAKFVMVFSLLRNALGVQQVPPNQVINGIALILSIFVIFPVGLQMYKLAEPVIQNEAPPSMTDPKAAQFIVKVATIAKEPLRTFLINNSLPAHQKNFYRIAFRMLPEELKEYITVDHFIVLIPSYITSQVKNGFEIGVLIYLPFFVIDLVVSNILLAMGMMMLSPVTISMPLKIFMLVMLDGWTLLTQGLILSYR
jgi:type III secretion protein R